MSISTRVLWAAVLLVGIGCGVAGVLGLAGEYWWRLDLLAHFRMQYTLALAALFLACAALRRWPLLGLTTGLLAPNLILMAPLYLDGPAPAAESGLTLRVALFNVHRDNTRYQPVLDHLRAADADVVVALETTHEWAGHLERALPRYSAVGEAREDAFGLMVLSRHALVYSDVVYLGDTGLPAVEIAFERDGQRVALLAVHPPPPVTRDLAERRDRVIADVTPWLRRVEPTAAHVVVVGDMNATPWSHPMRRLARSSDLVNAVFGFGWRATWPRDLIPLRVPIDHVLHSRSLTAVDWQAGPFHGSDHRPVVVTLATAAP